MAARIVFLTGKGGTGKSSVARALAHAARQRRIRTLLVRMPDARNAAADHAARLRPLTRSRSGERVLDERADLGEFLTRVLGLAFVARRLQDSSTFSAVAAAAPGLRDLVALTAITSEARWRRGLVIVDAPSTGHAVPMLTAPSRVLELIGFGPVANEAERARDVVRDARAFRVLLLATPEELAITEVVALRDELIANALPAPRVVVNALWPAYVRPEDGERVVAASPDAALHWRRHCRQTALVTALEAEVGPCPRIGFSFTRAFADADGDDADSARDIDALLDLVMEDPR